MRQRLSVIGDSSDPEFIAIRDLCLSKGWAITIIPLDGSAASIRPKVPTENEIRENAEQSRNHISGQTILSTAVNFLSGRKDHKAIRSDIIKEFKSVGYKAGSANNAISRLKKHRFVMEDKHGIIKLIAIPTKDQLDAAMYTRKHPSK